MKNLDFDQLLLYIDVEKIISFGNDSIYSNDIDLIIISNDFDPMYSTKRRIYAEKLIDASKKLDLICITLEEFSEMKNNSTLFSKKILSDGVIIYDKRKF